MSALSDNELQEALRDLPEWSGDSNGIKRSYEFKDFKAAINYMSGLADAIDADNHHPEWTNVYNTVSVRLRSHDADDKVTSKDIKLAKLLEKAAS